VTARLRSEWPWWSAALLAVAVMSWTGLVGFAWTDYDREAAGAYLALSHGDISGFFASIPAYGGALIVRAPFAGVTALLGGGELAIYRAVSIPCLLAVAWLALAIVRRMGRRGCPASSRAIVLALCVANPVTFRALEIGHPEELLCAVFAIGAVLTAADGRTIVTGLLLGLALATKAWAVLAIGPVLLALPARRLAALAIAGAVAAVVLAPIVLFAPHVAALTTAATSTGTAFQPWQIFWFLGDPGHVVLGGDGVPKPWGYRVAPEALLPLTHPFIAALVVPATLAWAWLRRGDARAGGEQLLALLALLFLLRCVLDPWNNVYYALPFLLALTAWEGLCRRDRPPVLALVATVLVWATFQWAPDALSPDMQCVFYLAWALPLAVWLGRACFVPAFADRSDATRRIARTDIAGVRGIGYSSPKR
jgi:hypothetical protein